MQMISHHQIFLPALMGHCTALANTEGHRGYAQSIHPAYTHHIRYGQPNF